MSASARRHVLDALTCRGAAYELVELEIPGGGRCRVIKDAPASVVDLLLDTRRFGELEFISYLDERHTFASVIDKTARLADALRRLDAGPQDRVAICMRNCPEWPAAFFAPMALGAVTVSLNGWWSGEEIAEGLRDAGARILIVDEERLRRIESRLPKLGVQVIAVRTHGPVPHGSVHWADAMRAARDVELKPAASSPDDDCLMLYTSGSTAGPKAAVSTHRNVIHAVLGWEIENRAQAILRAIPLPREPFEIQHRVLVTIPFFHVTACHVCMLSGLRLGRRLTLMHRWNPAEALDIIDRDRIPHVISVPTVTGDLVREAAAAGRRLPSLLAVGGGGSHRPAQQVTAIPDTFENALPSTGWGMTETNAIGTQIAPPDYLRVPESSGRLSALMDMRFVDPVTGTDMPSGRVGEVWVRGTPVVRRYWNRPEATAKAFQDGWFRTGDLAYMDEEEFVYFVDRIKDMVIRGGENISCLHVENALYHCDGVAEAVAFGIPDERLGEDLAAVVVPKEGARLTAAGVREFLAAHLGRFEVPASIVFQHAPLPRLATGKFDKRRIREALLARLANA